jgi:adenylosuccinate lyase
VGKLSGAVGTHAHLDPRVEEYVCEKLGLKAAIFPRRSSSATGTPIS